ncbi:Neurotransmitter-gated ion-channel [Trinorchestia longiramus]|nr:Neurotransmitter-gated ion-channel [Trinorchestia longiramus]
MSRSGFRAHIDAPGTETTRRLKRTKISILENTSRQNLSKKTTTTSTPEPVTTTQQLETKFLQKKTMYHPLVSDARHVRNKSSEKLLIRELQSFWSKQQWWPSSIYKSPHHNTTHYNTTHNNHIHEQFKLTKTSLKVLENSKTNHLGEDGVKSNKLHNVDEKSLGSEKKKQISTNYGHEKNDHLNAASEHFLNASGVSTNQWKLDKEEKFGKYFQNYSSFATRTPTEKYNGIRSQPKTGSVSTYKFHDNFDRKKSGNLDDFLADEPIPYHPAGIKKDLAVLSKNISEILESLLRNYNNKIRPGYTEGKLTTIKLNMLIRSMGPITEKDMKYSMDCYLRQEWHDERLTFKGPLAELTLNIKMLEALWKPDTFFHNGLGSYVHMITRPNKLFRITQDGSILYSMRLTIKAKCPMELRNFPMDKQSCPLIISSYAYPEREVKYQWDKKLVSFESGMAFSQFDLLNTKCTNYSTGWRTGQANYSVLQVNFNLQRHTGYFLIQVYVPCFLIVVLSWVSFWLNREATSDRVGLGITTVLTLSTISLDSRTDLPKVHYATALDWFILMSFGSCMATLLQCAGVHYFTKVGSGELLPESEWQDVEGTEEEVVPSAGRRILSRPQTTSTFSIGEREGSVADLGNFVLKDQDQNCSAYHGSEQHGRLSETQEVFQQQHPTNSKKEIHQEGLYTKTTHRYQSQRRMYNDVEMSQRFVPEVPQITCQSCETQYSSSEILLNSNPHVNSLETQSYIQPERAQSLCQDQNCDFNQSFMFNVKKEFPTNLCTEEEFAKQSTDNQCRNVAAAQKPGRLSTFYAAWNSGNPATSSDDSIQNLKNAETQTSKKEGFWFQLARCVVGSESYRRARERQATITGSVNSVSKIDKLSRVLFPLSYGLLNLWYWYSYYDAELTSSSAEPGFNLKL